ncbi:hypothetical protein FD755_024404 [Muntiacus reevesi]|uniref:CCDC144C-like coiled-coil domain-containing protein n=1 Tax=Muntiacus reevesi TaxID=9886 RepID=A0A5N3V9S8_MUNRE|nr:hypothetical protein FD755_024404 [Muntiacus reevesi]
MKPSQQSNRNIEAKCGILRPESTTFSEDNNSDSNIEDVVKTFPKPSPRFEGICQPAFPSPEPVPKLLKSVAGLGPTKVPDSGRKAKDLLRKNHLLQDEIANLRREIDAVKIQNREDEKKYSEDIENLQKAMKSNEEILTQTISQSGELKTKQTKTKSYCSRLTADIHDDDQGQTSQRDLELTFQRAKAERLCLQDQMKFDVTKLKSNSETVSQQLSEVESKFRLEIIKLHQMTDNLREKTLMLECAQRDLRQAECQKQEIEHMYRNEQGKVNEYL